MKILHISDLHMNSSNNESFSSMVIDAIENQKDEENDLSPDILLITGDFTTKAQMVEFNNAKQEIEKIIHAFPTIKNCILVPGNHDYSWETEKSEDRVVNYDFFLKGCLQVGICENNDESIPKSTANVLSHYYVRHAIVEEDDFALLIIGMNSVILDSKERAGQGYFEKAQHDACKKLIDFYKKKYEKTKTKLKILAAFHHHILPVSSVEHDTLRNSEKFSLTLDARRTLNFLVNNGVCIAVHGHQHQPSIVRWRDEMKPELDDLCVISVGSMTPFKNDLGDASKNNFMIYDIHLNDVLVYSFENSSSDWDIMELSHEPHRISIKNCNERFPCEVTQNALLPKEVMMCEYDSTSDTSDLFYLFLNVTDCEQARGKIEEFVQKTELIEEKNLCGLHYLYGKYDILLKYRCKEGDLFHRKLKEHLTKNNIMNDSSKAYFMNVSFENKDFVSVQTIPILKNPEVYLNSTWNMATLTVYLKPELTQKMFFNRLNSLIKSFNAEHNTKIEDIIRSYAVGQDGAVIFELFISCYQFPMLARFTNLIEDIIRNYAIDKNTHIIYYFDERGI